MDVLVEGFIACNGMIWQGNTLYVTESILEHMPQDAQNGILTSGVYAFSLEELGQKETIRLAPYSAEKQNPHLAITFNREANGFGADGIAIDDAGYIYTTVSGAIYKTLLGLDNKEIKTKLFAEDKNTQQSFDGIVWNSADRKLYTVGFLENALYAIDEQGNIETLHQNGDTNGENGLLDQPAEVVLRNNELVIVNMDLGAYSPDDVNTKPDEPYTISKLNLENMTFTDTINKLDKAMDPDVFTMLVKIYTEENDPKRPQFMEALKGDVRGGKSEKGNIAFQLYQDNNNKNNYFLYELWENRNALLHHFEQPWTKEVLALAAQKKGKAAEFIYLKDLNPISESEIKKQSEIKQSVDLMVILEVKEGFQQKFIEQFQKSIALTRKTEKGNIAFHLYEIIGSKTQFILYERWKDKDALDYHREQEYTNELFKVFGEVLDEKNFKNNTFLNGIVPITRIE
jgi:quinol monooxygenase YgiN/sugar lactone lactonase YvrE